MKSRWLQLKNKEHRKKKKKERNLQERRRRKKIVILRCVCVVNKIFEKKKEIKFPARMERMRPATHRPSTTTNVQRRISAKRPSRTRAASPSTNAVDDDRHDLVIQQSMDQISVRNVFGLMEKFDKWEMCEILAARDAHWLLTNADVYKVKFFCLSNNGNEFPFGRLQRIILMDLFDNFKRLVNLIWIFYFLSMRISNVWILEKFINFFAN